MKIEIHSKTKGDILFRNVQNIHTVVDFINGQPQYKIRILQVNHRDSIIVDDVTSFDIYESASTWIDLDEKRIICPHCGEIFKKSIINNTTINFCPHCGDAVDTVSYLKDTLVIPD